jgi:hypothetical protein
MRGSGLEMARGDSWEVVGELGQWGREPTKKFGPESFGGAWRLGCDELSLLLKETAGKHFSDEGRRTNRGNVRRPECVTFAV